MKTNQLKKMTMTAKVLLYQKKSARHFVFLTSREWVSGRSCAMEIGSLLKTGSPTEIDLD